MKWFCRACRMRCLLHTTPCASSALLYCQGLSITSAGVSTAFLSTPSFVLLSLWNDLLRRLGFYCLFVVRMLVVLELSTVDLAFLCLIWTCAIAESSTTDSNAAPLLRCHFVELWNSQIYVHKYLVIESIHSQRIDLLIFIINHQSTQHAGEALMNASKILPNPC